jgi:phosphatidylglycerol:prolipoprotein diacylglycerol transferase
LENVYHISFPGLGIDLNINPIAFYIFKHPVHWYGIIISVGFAIAFAYAIKRAWNFDIDPNVFADIILSAGIFGIIGARIYYIIFSNDLEYIKKPLSMLYIWDGGIAIYGAIIGGIIGGFFNSKEKQINFYSVLDLASLGLLIGQSVGRWGNFLNQEAFGTKTDLPWRMASEKTNFTAVHPCFLYESLFCALIFFVLHFFSRKQSQKPGQVFGLYLICYGTCRFFIEGLRADSLYLWGGFIRISQFLSLCSMIFGFFLLIKCGKTHKMSQKNV